MFALGVKMSNRPDFLWDVIPKIYDSAKQVCYAKVRDELIDHAQELQAIHDRYFRETDEAVLWPPPAYPKRSRRKRRAVKRSFQLFICFVFFSIYASSRVLAHSGPHGYCGFLIASRRKSADWRRDERQTRMDTGENPKVGFYNRGRLNGAIYQMTALAKRKSRLTFETSDAVRYRGRLREVVIEATEYTAAVRLKGTRQRFEMSWAGIYNHAVRVAVEKARAEKKAKRGGRA